ncbi:MFS transporter [uncultured Adlercreutzia sp.]|uniref:MFS transporter n=1 Tax=uncultured Adlercreutzia sp. TaxID=875803 RepID=UPI0026746B75|nr:MFS transporter [uncultured Adlercreutzia sp.]
MGGRATARALAPLFAAGFLAYGYNNIFMTLTPTFVTSLGGSLAEAGLQNSVYLAVAVVLRFAFGPLADRWGTKPVMAAGLASFIVGGALFPFAGAFWQVVAVRCIQAIGLAAFWSSATATVSNTAPPESRGWWLGLYRLVTSVSLLVGPLVAFELVDVAGFAACFGLLTACAAAALLCVMALGRLGAEPSASGEAARPSAAPASGAAPSPGDSLRQSVSAVVLAVVVGGTFIAAVGYGLLFSFAGTAAAAMGLALGAGWYFSLVGLGGLAANPVAGLLADRLGPRRLLGAHLLLVAAGLALFPLAAHSSAAFAASGLAAGYGYAGAMVCAQAEAASRVSAAYCATVLALQQNAIDLGIASAGAIFGLAFTAMGPAAPGPFLVQAAAVLAAALLLLRRAR